MSWATAAIDGVANTYQYALEKFRTPRKTPRYVGAEVQTAPMGVPADLWLGMSQDKRMEIATKISWIYSNVIRIGNEVSAAKFQVFRRGTKEEDIDHEFERILQSPNEFFTRTALLQYLVWGLSLDEWGAFWYLAPDRNTGKLSEIWPMALGTVKPIKDKNQFVKHYLYTPRSKDNAPFPIPKRFICRFIYANPRNLWKSLPPLDAASLAIDTYGGIATTQRDLFTQSRGVPLSVISFDPNIGETDFAAIRQRIREDWESERKIALARGGTMDIQTIGFSNSQLQVIESSEFNRDEFDAIFMGGIQWRAAGITGEERDEINKEIKEVVIRPLHQLTAEQMQLNIINPFYGPEFIGEFEDVRAQDRAIQIQEHQVNWTGVTFDEARRDLSLPEYNEEQLPGLGNLPLRLATNPSFVLQFYGLADTRDPNEAPDEVGNTFDLQDPEQMTNQLSGEQKGAIDLSQAINEGVKEELKRYQKVLVRTWRKKEQAQDLVDRQFDSDIIFDEVFTDIKIFAKWLN
ncbi:MAG: phage portal protein [Planctomycetota bacterium]|jgi:hypothetical protein